MTCISCGDCCRILSRDGRVSLRLVPRETEYFPKYAVRPEIAFGKDERSLTIVMWQMVRQPCPMLRENRCKIYRDRPLVCRMWPLNYTDKGLVFRGCSQLKEGEKYSLPEDSAEMRALQAMRAYHREIAEKWIGKVQAWRWDGKWRKGEAKSV